MRACKVRLSKARGNVSGKRRRARQWRRQAVRHDGAHGQHPRRHVEHDRVGRGSGARHQRHRNRPDARGVEREVAGAAVAAEDPGAHVDRVLARVAVERLTPAHIGARTRARWSKEGGRGEFKTPGTVKDFASFTKGHAYTDEKAGR